MCASDQEAAGKIRQRLTAESCVQGRAEVPLRTEGPFRPGARRQVGNLPAGSDMECAPVRDRAVAPGLLGARLPSARSPPSAGRWCPPHRGLVHGKCMKVERSPKCDSFPSGTSHIPDAQGWCRPNAGLGGSISAPTGSPASQHSHGRLCRDRGRGKRHLWASRPESRELFDQHGNPISEGRPGKRHVPGDP